MSLVEFLTKKLEPLRAEYTAATADGKVTFSEAWKMLRAAVRITVQLAQGYGAASQMPGVEKKAGVMDALTWLYDKVAPTVHLPTWLYVLSFFKPSMTRSIVLFVLDQLVESAVDSLPAPQPEPDAA